MKKLLPFALPAYAFFSLTSMAGMNIGFLILSLGLIAAILIKMPALPVESDGSFAAAMKGYRLWGWALFGSCILSLLCAKFFPFSYADHAPEITWHGFQKIWYMICPFILVQAFRRFQHFEKVIRIWWSTAVVLLVMAVIQFFTGWPLKQKLPYSDHLYHAILLLGHHLSVASILVFPTFTALSVALGKWSRERCLDRLALTAGSAGLIILFLSWARTGWLSIIIGMILLFAKFLKPKHFTTALVSLIVILSTLTLLPTVRSRIVSNVGIIDRFRLWQANIDFFKHRPLTGIGWLKTQEMSEFYFKHIDPTYYKSYFWGHAHSNFFEMLGGTGLLGLIAFLGWSWFTLRLAYQTANRFRANQQFRWADFSWGLFVALVLLHFNGLTNVTFWEGKVMHQQMLAVGMLLILQFWLPSTQQK